MRTIIDILEMNNKLLELLEANVDALTAFKKDPTKENELRLKETSSALRQWTEVAQLELRLHRLNLLGGACGAAGVAHRPYRTKES